jgi:hypothetical protein
MEWGVTFNAWVAVSGISVTNAGSCISVFIALFRCGFVYAVYFRALVFKAMVMNSAELEQTYEHKDFVKNFFYKKFFP